MSVRGAVHQRGIRIDSQRKLLRHCMLRTQREQVIRDARRKAQVIVKRKSHAVAPIRRQQWHLCRGSHRFVAGRKEGIREKVVPAEIV